MMFRLSDLYQQGLRDTRKPWEIERDVRLFLQPHNTGWLLNGGLAQLMRVFGNG